MPCIPRQSAPATRLWFHFNRPSFASNAKLHGTHPHFPLCLTSLTSWHCGHIGPSRTFPGFPISGTPSVPPTATATDELTPACSTPVFRQLRRGHLCGILPSFLGNHFHPHAIHSYASTSITRIIWYTVPWRTVPNQWATVPNLFSVFGQIWGHAGKIAPARGASTGARTETPAPFLRTFPRVTWCHDVSYVQ